MLRQRIDRAVKAKHRVSTTYCPGDTVLAWRLGNSKLSGTKKTGIHHGAWYGPATVLGTETRINEEGQREPSSIVWVVVNGRLWRCAPQQLRKATTRETSEEELLQRRPWTFQEIVKDMKLGEYHDNIPHGVPYEEEMEEPPTIDDMEIDDKDNSERRRAREVDETEDNPRPPRRRIGKKTSEAQWAEAEQAATRALKMTETGFFNTLAKTPGKVLEIAFPTVDSAHKVRTLLRDPAAYVVSNLRRKRVEVNMKTLTDSEKELIRLGKGKEVREFIKEEVVTKLLADENVSKDEAMRMRWVITWKKDESSPFRGFRF